MTEFRKLIEILIGAEGVIIEEPSTLVGCILKATSIEYNMRCVNYKYKSPDLIEEETTQVLVDGFTREVFSSLLGGAFTGRKHKKRYKTSKERLSEGYPLFGIQEYISDFFNIDYYVIIPREDSVYIDIGNIQHTYYHKFRNSILLLYRDGMYSLISVKEDDTLTSVFSPEWDLIRNINAGN